MSKTGLLIICSLIALFTSSGLRAFAGDAPGHRWSSNSSSSGSSASGQRWGSDSSSSGSGASGPAWRSNTSESATSFSNRNTSGAGQSAWHASSSNTGSSSSSPVIPGTSIPSTVTHFIITNKTASPVTIGVQCQLPGALVQDGCTTNISDMAILDLTSGSPTPQPFTTFSTGQGTFPLASMHQYEIVNLKTNPYSAPANQQQNCLQGLIVSFGQWNSCPATQPNTPAFPVPFTPGPDIPNGSNAAEPSLNLPSTINGAAVAGTGSTEVCDITCVNGANSILKLTITSPSQPPAGGSQALPWTYDASGSIAAGQTFSTTNSWVNVKDKCDNNCFVLVNGIPVDRPGVFPYGCTQCNKNPDPAPPCGQFCAAQNGLPPNTGCTFNRAPQKTNPVTAQFGGTVDFSYLSTAVPPSGCQSLGQP